MKKRYLGDRLEIHSYKHNGKIHRAWDEAVLLEENNNYMVFGNNKTLVTESSGIKWRTKEPAIMYFFKDCWFNVIAQIKKDGIHFYCNIATPFVIEENTIKYIDYDLDLKIFPNGHFKVLDEREYDYHKKIMGYSEFLDKSINLGLSELVNRYKNNDQIFNSEKNLNYYDKYLKLKSSAEKGNFVS